MTDYAFIKSENAFEKDRIIKALSVLTQSPLGQELIQDAQKNQTTLGFANVQGCFGGYDEYKNQVVLGSHIDDDRLIATLAHEMRHAQQFAKGVDLKPLELAPKDYLHSQAMIEADANVVACMVAWDLKEQGKSGVFETLKEGGRTLVGVFEKTALNGGLKDGTTQKETFYAWFKDSHLSAHYENSYLRAVHVFKMKATEEEKANAFQRKAPVTDNINKVCTLNSRCYLGKEAEAFFNAPERNTVSAGTLVSLYDHLNEVYKFSDKQDKRDVMAHRFGLKYTPSDMDWMYFDVSEKKPSLKQSQQFKLATLASRKAIQK